MHFRHLTLSLSIMERNVVNKFFKKFECNIYRIALIEFCDIV